MNANKMHIANPGADLIADEEDVLDELLQLGGASVLELGCGKAEKTRIVAQKAARVVALEVDEIQLVRNRQLTELPNVSSGWICSARKYHEMRAAWRLIFTCCPNKHTAPNALPKFYLRQQIRAGKVHAYHFQELAMDICSRSKT